MKSKVEQLFHDAISEINNLRRANEILEAKVGVMDLFACVLRTTPAQRGCSISVDIAWLMQKYLDELNTPEAPLEAEERGEG